MKSNKLYLFVLAAFCLGLITLALPVVSSAQDDEALYARRYSKRDVAAIIASLEQSSDTFRRDFNSYVNDRSVSKNERNRLTRIVDNYEQALDNLRRNFDSSDNWWRSRNNVQSVMDESRQVNGMMNNLSFARKLERQWNQMRRDINRLAETYNLQRLDGTGGGGGNGGGGNGGGGDVPSWAIGTFYGRNPQTGGVITLNINRNGRVTITFENGGAPIYASMNGDRLSNGGIVSRVTKITNGIRTTRTDTGERIDYFLNNYGGGGGGDDNTGGNIPSWAIGTFYGRNPQTGGVITLNINRNGRVTITFENGGTFYASMNGDRLNNDGIVSRVSRTNNGIRTTREDNGESIDYRR
ncbi:MAG TPA: hypothetical protein VGC97_03480 [Pyrinomonadaceae bacterium]|jgi:hypothetical protein